METKLEKIKLKELKLYEKNHRKISRQKFSDLKKSFKELGNFGVLIIDENNTILAGNQRYQALKEVYGEDIEVEVKRLEGLSDAEKQIINIRANVSSGTFTDKVAAELEQIKDEIDIDLAGITINEFSNTEVKEEPQYEFSPEVLEEYNYVILYFKNSLDFMRAKSYFGLKRVQRKDISMKSSVGFNRVVDGKEFIERLENAESDSK